MKRTRKRSLIKMVDDSTIVVHDFKRRTSEGGGFEGYRALDYKPISSDTLKKIETENIDTLAKLFEAEAIDSGNQDCLVEKIIGKIKEGINNLDKQRLFHLDFYSRYGILRKTDRDDYKELLEIKLEELSALKEEHEVTKQLWTRYKGL